MTKTILVAQGQSLQVQLWKLVLESQRHSVLLTSPHMNLLEVAKVQPLDLMVVDMTTGLFNPYAFCRDCHSQLPDTPVILTHHARRHIEPAERRWAIYQGAAEVIPGLAAASDILDSLDRIYKAAKWSLPIDTDALYTVLEQAGLMPGEPNPVPSPTAPPQTAIQTPTAPPQSVKSEEPTEAKSSAPQVKYRLMYRGRPVN
ncbi:response regulator [Synechococcus sp. Nb3U1]|uniref:response regulator n=1 Tax=Synechococcus sp. Nb3U1 TaxID=1914529 RepID=UPI001F40FD02|nr:response regulator [Synechococcus sp. Nb3U1]MCF2970463.1 response regulator [Synechococcus sp. Nb3U1]